MNIVTIITFLFFTGLVGFLTWMITRKDDHGSSSGYFLAGRSLTFPIIAGSLLLTNLSTEQMVGLNGAAFTHGFAVMVWEVVAVIALVVMAMFFLPKFLRSGVATVPELLEIRFDHATQVITNIIFLIAYATILLPIILYSGALGMMGILDIKASLGLSDTAALWMIIPVVGIIGSTYALFGGLRTVAVSDTINGLGLLIGGFLITYFGISALGGDGGGFLAGLENFKSSQGINEATRMNSLGGDSSGVPYGTIFTGIMLLNMFYWCTNQQIIQRTFGAKSLQEGQKGVLLTGGLKLLGPMYLVIPGMIAFALFASQGIKADESYGKLVSFVLPSWLSGFFAAVLMGAILSSFNSALNSTCTLFSLGLYKSVLKQDATDQQVVRSGKIFGWIIAGAAICVAPLLAQTGSIFGYLQKMNGIYFIPILAVVVVGMLSKRVPALGAKLALIAGFIIIPAGYFIPLAEQDLQVVAKDAVQLEGANNALVFNVHLNKKIDKTTIVNYTTQDGTAKSGTDYVSTAGTLTFMPGETIKTVAVELLQVPGKSAEIDNQDRTAMFLSVKNMADKNIDIQTSYVTPLGKMAAVGRILDSSLDNDEQRKKLRKFLKEAKKVPELGFKTLTDYIQEFHFLGITFAGLVGMMLLVGAVKPRATAWIQEDVKAIDMTPWKHAGKVSVILIFLVLLIYACFFSSAGL